jgi:aspartyl-tRNA synthetase
VSAYRDMLCGEPRPDHAGRELTLSGWVGGRRDHGGLVFIDLRDRTGIVQLVMDPDRSPEAHAVAQALRLESVVRARGRLVPRSEAQRNDQLPTGDVELAVASLELLSPSEVLPFQLDDENVDEGLRIRHRYLDLRRPRMQELQEIRARAVRSIRRFLDEHGFLDLETPTMTRATPEGARDFVIPARLEPGKFFALPQSPQLYKQLLMCGGFDRYYQIAHCWRDEAQRADRALEFTQLDLEMSFVEQEDVLSLTEQLIAEVWRDAGHEVELPFPRMPYGEAVARYGSDKPDLRYGLEIGDVGAAVAGSEFGVFAGAVAAGGVVRCLSVPGAAQALSRKDFDELAEFAKEWGGKGLAYLIFEADGSVRSPIAKFLGEAEIAAIRDASGAVPGSVAFIAADARPVVERVLGALRPHLARRFELIPAGQWKFLFVVDFPLFKQTDDGSGWTAEHHPFTAPKREHEDLLESDPGAVLSDAYDMVLNGLEMASGSIRINRADLQTRVLDVIGIDPAEAEERFGFLLRALRFGAPPHGGIAPGIDRIAMQLGDTDNLREVVTFPKLGGGADPLTGAPAPLSPEQLAELGLAIASPKP